MKKFIILLLLLTVAGSTWAVDRNWTNGNGNRLWSTAANWSGSAVPTTADKACIRNQAISGPIIQSGITAVANKIVLGDFSSTRDTLDITGGSLTTSGTSAWFILGYGAANNGIITMSGGTVTIGGSFYVGNSGRGTLTISGGSITIAGTFGVAQLTGSTGDVFLNGGTITANSTFNMTSGASMDIAGGTLIVNGDVRTTINTYITNGWITAYGGAGTFNIDYNTTNPGKTTVTASQDVPPPGKATTPNPGNGATGIGITTDLGWAAGSGATSHDVYFGTSSPGTFRGNQASTSYDTGTMANNTPYYWRIDEKNAGGTTTGDVWNFTTAAATGVDRNWTGAGDKLWRTASNWSGSAVPTGADKAAIRGNYSAANGPHIDASTTAVANQIVLGDWSSTVDNLTMTGGSLTTNSWFILGYGATNNGIVTISGGTITVNDGTGGFYIGLGGAGTLNMDGGNITVSNTFGVAQNAGSTGHAYLDGGTITCGALNMTTNGRIDITGGTLIVNGDARTQINGYVSSGWFTAYGGTGTLNIDYDGINPGKTTVTASASSLPGLATNPNPANGATGVSITNDLSWTAGSGATSHDVYFGTTSPGTFRGNQAGTTYDTGTMTNNKVYYWRIDEKNSYGTRTGTVWSFTTQGTVAVVREKGPYLIYTGTNTQMKVCWQVDVSAACTIAWGTDTNYGMGSSQTTEYGSDHQHTYTISGLTPGIKYYYRVTMGSNNYTGNFYAAPAASATNVKFFMYGDTRSSPASHNAVAGRMLSTISGDAAYQTIALLAGDYVETDSESTWLSQWFTAGSNTNIWTLNANMPIMGAIGNHETTGTGVTIFRKYWPYPYYNASRYYYSFDYGPVHFTVVDQYTSYTSGSTQHTWLVNDLDTTTKPYKIIVLHQPGWSCGAGHGNDTTVQNTIQPLCTTYGAKIVLGGHNHYYSRGLVSGIHHLTSGGGGAGLVTPLMGQPNIVYPPNNTVSKVLNCTKVEVVGNTLTATTINASTGTVLDTFTVTP